MPFLDVNDLHVRLQTQRGPADAVRGVSFSLARGETLGLIGESGCGKSLHRHGVAGPAARQCSGHRQHPFDGQELVGLPDAALCEVRGNRIGMIFQEPMTALNPVHTIGRQIGGAPAPAPRSFDAADARKQAIALLDRVGIADATRRLDAYPHQFSGGQRQRITIAMALACGPDLLIADEPTTALDVTIQQQILDLISDLVAERGMALILISHDLGVIAQNVDRMLVMYGGSVVESGPTASVFAAHGPPVHARPVWRPAAAGRPRGTARLATIAGTVPELVDLPAGCPFADRCRFAATECHGTLRPPATVDPHDGRRCARGALLPAGRCGGQSCGPGPLRQPHERLSTPLLEPASART